MPRTKPRRRLLAIDKIVRADDVQPRDHLSHETVDDYVEALDRGKELPPVHVFRDEDGPYLLAHGYHRHSAHQRRLEGGADTDRIKCFVHEGTREEAIWYACACNQDTALRRSQADKRRAVTMALKNENGEGLSNRQIADYVGVDEGTVRRCRASLESTAELPQSTIREGRDGRKINTAPIGRSKQQAGQPPETIQASAESVEVLPVPAPPVETASAGSVSNIPKGDDVVCPNCKHLGPLSEGECPKCHLPIGCPRCNRAELDENGHCPFCDEADARRRQEAAQQPDEKWNEVEALLVKWFALDTNDPKEGFVRYEELGIRLAVTFKDNAER